MWTVSSWSLSQLPEGVPLALQEAPHLHTGEGRREGPSPWPWPGSATDEAGLPTQPEEGP